MSIAAGAPLPMTPPPSTPDPVWLPIPLRFGVASCTEISGRGSEGGRSKNSANAKERRNVKRCETDGRAATGGGEACVRARAGEREESDAGREGPVGREGEARHGLITNTSLHEAEAEDAQTLED